MQPFLKSPLFTEQFKFGAKHWIGVDTTLLIPTQFANIRDALKYLDDKSWPDNVTVTIKFAAGSYDLSDLCLTYADNTIEIKRNITISGDSVLQKNISSLASTSGSYGNWDVTLNISDTTGLAIGMFVLIGSVAGTGDCKYIQGCWEIIDIPSSTQITVKNTNRNSTFVSTLTGGNISIPTTKLVYNLNNSINFKITNQAVNFKDLIIQSSVPPGGAQAAILLYNSGSCDFSTVGITGFYHGIRMYSGKVIANELYISGNKHGINSYDNSTLKHVKLYVTGNHYYGLKLYYNSIFGGDNYGGNSAVILGNGSADIVAYYGSYATVTSGNYSTTSPAINTVGNHNSYIKG